MDVGMPKAGTIKNPQTLINNRDFFEHAYSY